MCIRYRRRDPNTPYKFPLTGLLCWDMYADWPENSRRRGRVAGWVPAERKPIIERAKETTVGPQDPAGF